MHLLEMSESGGAKPRIETVQPPAMARRPEQFDGGPFGAAISYVIRFKDHSRSEPCVQRKACDRQRHAAAV